MGLVMDRLQFLHGDMGIHFRAGEIRVAEHGLDEADVGPVFEHERGHGVPEDVAGSLLADLRGLDVAAHQAGDIGRHDGFAQWVRNSVCSVGLRKREGRTSVT